MRRKLHSKILLGVLTCFVSEPSADGFSTILYRRQNYRNDQHQLHRKTCFWGSHTIIRLNSNNNDSNAEDRDISPSTQKGSSKRLEEDISKKFSHSRDKAISALSQPTATSEDATSSKDQTQFSRSRGKKRRNVAKRNSSGRAKSQDTLLPKRPGGFQNVGKRRNSRKRNMSEAHEESDGDSFFSLLPPPIKGSTPSSNSSTDDSLSDGLSSWEDFLGAGSTPTPSRPYKQSSTTREEGVSLVPPGAEDIKKEKSDKVPSAVSKVDTNGGVDRLPSIADLFPPDFSSRKNKNGDSAIYSEDDFANDEVTAPPHMALDGVLPVSDLFYRSSQSMMEDEEETSDDEELPFSAEQTDRLSTGNRIRVRRNQARKSSSATGRSSNRGRKASLSRKMIRRGMEMLVGGVPINADPPQRYVDLMYVHKEAQKVEWHGAITINTRDFGPMLHGPSVGMLSKMEQGLFCEHFVHYTTKWSVCPKDLRTILKSFNADAMGAMEDEDEFSSSFSAPDDDEAVVPSKQFINDAETIFDARDASVTENSTQGFGQLTSFSSTIPVDPEGAESELQANLGGKLVFSIGVSREELESGDSELEVPVLERVLARGIASSTESSGFNVVFTKLVLTDLDDGATMISGEFQLNLKDDQSMSYDEMERKAHRINSSLAQAMDEGDMQLALAAAAKEETAWPEAVRKRVVEEFLFDDDDVDGPWEVKDQEGEDEGADVDQNDEEPSLSEERGLDSYSGARGQSFDEVSGPFGTPGSVEYHKDDIFLGGGNGGVFWDYSEKNAANAPYGGALGLRLVEAVTERAKERQPRVIAIGDVHGCIDELQELLRQCDYRPGDLVVFLGDLVSKGPDSIAVVQMAREIGAIGVRGNHDFEVIRWHQAIKSGVDPPVVGSEHFHIASCLSKADMKWMCSLPWYISSRELSTLFVHAGFVSGIRLAKQNPRLMMNMRSILPDGTVTSKFFNNWPWARLWDGPQTVLFGHDADRGLQQYEHAIGLDTGCVYGGRLTACILPEKRLVSVSARREYFKYRRKHYD